MWPGAVLMPTQPPRVLRECVCVVYKLLSCYSGIPSFLLMAGSDLFTGHAPRSYDTHNLEDLFRQTKVFGPLCSIQEA